MKRWAIIAVAFCAILARAGTEDFTLATWAADPLQIAVFYHSPAKPFVQFVYPELPAEGSGAEGLNVAFEAGKAGKWFIEEQRGGADLVETGVATHDERLVDLGVRVLNWGFARQNPAGGWDCPDVFHSATFFVEAAARAALCLRQAGWPKYAPQVKDWTAHLRAAGAWMNRPEILDSDPYFYQYTHRSYLAAAALGETAALTGDKALAATAERIARTAIQFQWPDGVNPEKGGYDVGYQVTGALFALRYHPVCDAPDLRKAIDLMIARAIAFELTKINAQGVISPEGSTRMGHEVNRSGQPKVVGYRPIIQALIGADLLAGTSQCHATAELMAHNQGWLSPAN